MAATPVRLIDNLPSAVRAAADRGWRMFPVQQRGKVPLVKEWQRVATSDVDQLEAWAGRFPDCNWGVAAGPLSGVLALDVDGNSGKDALRQYELQGQEIPETLTVNTGRGIHLYFRWPNGQGIRNSAGKLAQGLDIRGEGGFLVLPPSEHHTGSRYTYKASDAEIADVPEWLLALLREPAPRPKLLAGQMNGAIPQGRRNATLTSLAGTMRKRGMSSAAIEAALLEENRQQCQPTLPESEVREIAASNARYVPGASAKGQSLRPVLVRLSDVESRPVDWLWEPYLPKGMLALLSGDPGGGKTFLSLAIAAALSNGQTPFTLEPCEPVNTLYLSLENSAEHVVKPRFELLKGDCNRFQLLEGATNAENRQTGTITLSDTALLEQAIIDVQAGLLIVDPIQSYLGAEVDAHRSNETRPILDGLGQLGRKYGCCILLVRHLSKASGGRAIHRGLGSIDITGAARTELMVGSAPNEPQTRALVQVKNNLGPYGDSLGFTIGENGLAWTGKSSLTSADLLAPETQTKSDVSGAVDFLKDSLASGPKLQRELVKQSEFSERTLQRASKRLPVKKERDGERGPWRWSLGSTYTSIHRIPDNTDN